MRKITHPCIWEATVYVGASDAPWPQLADIVEAAFLFYISLSLCLLLVVCAEEWTDKRDLSEAQVRAALLEMCSKLLQTENTYMEEVASCQLCTLEWTVTPQLRSFTGVASSNGAD
eukprot:5806610-Amphidinium_carterae.2